MAYILVRTSIVRESEPGKLLDSVEVAKEIEKIDGVKAAVLVREAHDAYGEDVGVGDFYTTDAAAERVTP
jgi:hypothetical protein